MIFNPACLAPKTHDKNDKTAQSQFPFFSAPCFLTADPPVRFLFVRARTNEP